MADAALYEDSFSITSHDPGKYDRVARVAGTSSDNTTIMTLDINTDLYPLVVGDSVQLMIASTLNLDGTKDEMERTGWREKKGPSLADSYDYVCYGKVYKFEDGEDGEIM
jgi:DNA-directed RNA polymerase I, II, and III subunit RPABC3